MNTATPRPLRVLQISDSHLFAQCGQRLLNVDTDASLCGVIRHILDHETGTDVVLATGDISQDGSPESYRRFVELAQPLAPVLRGLPGNHDANEVFYDVWKDHAQAVTDAGRWRLVMLDSSIAGSSAGHLAPDQLDLLHQALESAQDRHVLVAVHHNAVPVGSPWLDAMMIDNGHELLGVLQEFDNVRGLIWGHVHQEYDTVVNFGIPEISADGGRDTVTATAGAADTAPKRGEARSLRLLATPATCVQFTPRSVGFSLDVIDPGYRWLDLHDDGRIETGVVRVPGLGLIPDTGSGGY